LFMFIGVAAVGIWESLFVRPVALAGRTDRDSRVDALRGLALLMIFINHIPANPLTGATLASLGLADAADIFVLLAGFAATMAYGPVFDRQGFRAGAQRVWRRVAVIYAAQIGLCLAVSAMLVMAVQQFANPLYIETVNIWPVLHAPLMALRDAAILQFQPAMLDILPLYIALLAVFPLIYIAGRVMPALALLGSALLWFHVQRNGLNLPNGAGDDVWFFNPFAWQFIFTCGVVWGLLARAGVALPRSKVLMALFAGVVLAGFILRSPWSEVWHLPGLPALPERLMPESGKTDLAVHRIIYVLALVGLVWQCVPRSAALLSARPVRALANLGRHSLPLFSLGIVMSVLAHVAVVESGSGAAGLVTMSILGCMLSIVAGGMLAWNARRARTRQTGILPAGTVAVSA
jgi:hypothetical protein